MGLADNDTVGGGEEAEMATLTVALVVPPAPVQFRPKVVLAVSAPVDSLPEVGFDPDQPPVAEHPVAPVVDQVRLADAPAATVVGEALRLTVGGGVPPWLPEPPPPPQAATAMLHPSTASIIL